MMTGFFMGIKHDPTMCPLKPTTAHTCVTPKATNKLLVLMKVDFFSKVMSPVWHRIDLLPSTGSSVHMVKRMNTLE